MSQYIYNLYCTTLVHLNSRGHKLHYVLCRYNPQEAQATAHLLPLAVDALRGDGGVGVGSAQLDAVALGDLLHLRLDGLDGLPLLVGLCQGGLELLVGCDQTLRGEQRLVLPAAVYV